VDSTETGVRVNARAAAGETLAVEAEKLLVSVGRKPMTEGLGLDRVGVQMERDYVKVDALLHTNIPHIYAIGDLIPTPAYAHTASSEAILVAEQIAGHSVRPINYDHTPNCTYCDPEVASVGLTEAEARRRGHDVKTGKFPLPVLGKVMILGEKHGLAKFVADAKHHELLGVHLVGPHATDLIAEACIALTSEATVDEFVATIHAHPTVAEGIKEAAEGVFGKAIHV
jgi:dihydrolipoamide dehydrogenase